LPRAGGEFGTVVPLLASVRNRETRPTIKQQRSGTVVPLLCCFGYPVIILLNPAGVHFPVVEQSHALKLLPSMVLSPRVAV
jgi:hypothetical protein